MRILSIDFDYFIDTDIDTRNNKFPDGADELSKEECNKKWKYFYEEYPEINNIGVIPFFYILCGSLKYWFASDKCKVIVADSHKHIERCFDFSLEEPYYVKHIDFHHDCYISGGDTIDCANWVRILKEKSPESEVVWLKREDSETTSLMGEYPYESLTEYKCPHNHFDYIFICFSPEWTPPHLKKYFDILIESTDRFKDREFII